jgi:hypothetical protein
VELVSNRHLSSISCMKYRYVGGKYMHFMIASISLVNKAQLKHRLGSLGEMDTDPSEDRADHTPAVWAATTDPIYSLSSESNSEYDR